MPDETSIAKSLAAANAFFAAISAMDWEAAAKMVDSEAAHAFRNSQLASLVAWAQQRPAMMESRARNEMIGWSSDGTLHSDLAEQFAATPIAGVAGLRTLGELVAMSPPAFIATCLQMNNTHSDAGNDAVTGTRRRVLGGVMDGETIVHVLHRTDDSSCEYVDPHHVDVLRFVQRDDAWRVDLTAFNQDIASASSLMMLTEMGMLLPDPERDADA